MKKYWIAYEECCPESDGIWRKGTAIIDKHPINWIKEQGENAPLSSYSGTKLYIYRLTNYKKLNQDELTELEGCL